MKFTNAPFAIELIDNWLLPNNQMFFNSKTQEVNPKNLYVQINLLLAIGARRFVNDDFPREEALKYLKPFLEEVEDVWEKLGESDRFFIQYVYFVEGIFESIGESGRFEKLENLKHTTQVRRWMKKHGYVFSSVNLIERWLHPLGLEKGKFNLWLIASLVTGWLTKRHCEKGVNSEGCKEFLERNQLTFKQDELNLAYKSDMIYLEILNRVKEALEKEGQRISEFL